MNTNHTAGPWKVRDYGFDDAGSPRVHVEDAIGRTIVRSMGDLEQIDANARLIAAAPRLKDALRALIGTLPEGTMGGEWLEAMNALQQADGLPEFPSFYAAKATGTNA